MWKLHMMVSPPYPSKNLFQFQRVENFFKTNQKEIYVEKTQLQLIFLNNAEHFKMLKNFKK